MEARDAQAQQERSEALQVERSHQMACLLHLPLARLLLGYACASRALGLPCGQVSGKHQQGQQALSCPFWGAGPETSCCEAFDRRAVPLLLLCS